MKDFTTGKRLSKWYATGLCDYCQRWPVSLNKSRLIVSAKNSSRQPVLMIGWTSAFMGLGWQWKGYWHRVKPTRSELFSERNNYKNVKRLFRWSWIKTPNVIKA